MILSCVTKLSQAFANVESAVERELGVKSSAMLTQLSDSVSNINHSRLFFKPCSKESSSEFITRLSLRNLRLREHNKDLSQLLSTLSSIS